MSAPAPAGRGAVAIVRHSFYPFELNVKREAEALRDAGFAVHVICLRGSGEAKREDVEGVQVYRLPVAHQRGSILRYIWEYNAFFVLASLKLARLHRRHHFVAVQVNTMPDYLVYTALYPRMTGARVVLHLHEPVPELFRTMFPDRWFTGAFIRLLTAVEQGAIRFADRALTVTDQMRDNYVRRGADPSKFTVVVNVPDDRTFRIERYQPIIDRARALKAEERARGVFRVVTHGAIEERYGYDTIVKAVAQARADVPGIEFRFMGSGSFREGVLALAQELGVGDRVKYLGFVPFETMIEEIVMADVCVVPVKASPYSELVHTNKMYEYMAMQRPVAASRLGSVAAYAADDTLLFFEPGNAEDLAERLRWAARHPDELAAQVARASQLYEKHRWEREKNAYLGAYGDLTG
jgi:glycosyltransferase involved in cell wall biosynthesis